MLVDILLFLGSIAAAVAAYKFAYKIGEGISYLVHQGA